MTILGLDFETTGLNPEVDRVIEIGAVLWSTGNGGFPISMYSFFCYDKDFPEIHPEAAEANGLDNGFLKEYGKPFKKNMARIEGDFQAVVAHNGMNFDRLFYVAECKRAGIETWEMPWIDTAMDVKYPESITTRKLTYLAAEHGFLNPFAHRAVFDVLTMLIILQKYDVQAALEYSQQPLVILQALVSYDDRQKAKDTGYRWNPDEKRWLKTLRLPDVPEERKKAKETGFDIREIQPRLI